MTSARAAGDGFPLERPRRLRSTPGLRRLVAETRLHPADLVQPLFVAEGLSEPRALTLMPGVVQHCEASLPDAVRAAAEAGVGAVMLFGIPARRDAEGGCATDPTGILARAVRSSVAAAPGLPVIADLCLDEFTDHGHCGVLDAAGRVDNDATLAVYQQMAVVLAEAGAGILGASGMMDGQVGAVRAALDAAGQLDTAVLAYAAKYASAFYGPFREAVGSALVGDRRTYQQDPANGREAVAAAAARSEVPVAAYVVSGEYAMVEAAAAAGAVDRRAAVLEVLTSVRRAGADIVVTYWASEVAGWLKELS